MADYTVRFMWNGKRVAEMVTATSELDAIMKFNDAFREETNSLQRIQAGYKMVSVEVFKGFE